MTHKQQKHPLMPKRGDGAPNNVQIIHLGAKAVCTVSNFKRESFRSTADRGELLFLQILCLANSYTDFKEEYMLNILLGAIQWSINY